MKILVAVLSSALALTAAELPDRTSPSTRVNDVWSLKPSPEVKTTETPKKTAGLKWNALTPDELRMGPTPAPSSTGVLYKKDVWQQTQPSQTLNTSSSAKGMVLRSSFDSTPADNVSSSSPSTGTSQPRVQRRTLWDSLNPITSDKTTAGTTPPSPTPSPAPSPQPVITPAAALRSSWTFREVNPGVRSSTSQPSSSSLSSPSSSSLPSEKVNKRNLFSSDLSVVPRSEASASASGSTQHSSAVHEIRGLEFSLLTHHEFPPAPVPVPEPVPTPVPVPIKNPGVRDLFGTVPQLPVVPPVNQPTSPVRMQWGGIKPLSTAPAMTTPSTDSSISTMRQRDLFDGGLPQQSLENAGTSAPNPPSANPLRAAHDIFAPLAAPTRESESSVPASSPVSKAYIPLDPFDLSLVPAAPTDGAASRRKRELPEGLRSLWKEPVIAPNRSIYIGASSEAQAPQQRALFETEADKKAAQKSRLSSWGNEFNLLEGDAWDELTPTELSLHDREQKEAQSRRAAADAAAARARAQRINPAIYEDPAVRCSISGGVHAFAMQWSTAGTFSNGQEIVPFSTKWTDLIAYEIQPGVDLTLGSFIFKSHFSKGKIRGGNGEATGSSDNGSNSYNDHASLSGIQGTTAAVDAEVNAVMRFIHNQARLSFSVGWGRQEQNLILTEGVQDLPVNIHLDGLNSSYNAAWKGPWVGLAAGWDDVSDIHFEFGAAFHSVSYEGKADWNLRSDLIHPDGIVQNGKGRGLSMFAKFRQPLGHYSEWFGSVEWEHFIVENGEDYIYYTDGTQANTVLKNAEIQGYIVRVGVALRF